jgi:hypothetical protein
VKMMRICLNWKVLASLAAVGVGIYLIAPDVVVGLLPILLLAACPLSMLFMMRSMQQPQGQGQQMTQEPDVELTRGERIAQLRAQRAAFDDEIATLEWEEAPLAEKKERGH